MIVHRSRGPLWRVIVQTLGAIVWYAAFALWLLFSGDKEQ